MIRINISKVEVSTFANLTGLPVGSEKSLRVLTECKDGPFLRRKASWGGAPVCLSLPSNSHTKIASGAAQRLISPPHRRAERVRCRRVLFRLC